MQEAMATAAQEEANKKVKRVAAGLLGDPSSLPQKKKPD